MCEYACVCVTASVYLRRKCSSRMSLNVDLLRHRLPSVVKSTTEAQQCIFIFSRKLKGIFICRCGAERTGEK